MKTSRIWPLIILGALLLGGCLDFGPNISTMAPSSEHVKFCQTEMYLNPEVLIEPRGFMLTSGIDKHVLFKFVAHTNDVSKLFLSPPVDTLVMNPKKVSFLGGMSKDWWDPPSSGLVGANYDLPSAKHMNVAYVANDDDTLTVYIEWGET